MFRFAGFFGAGVAAATGCALRYSTASTALFGASALCDHQHAHDHASPEYDAARNEKFVAAEASHHQETVKYPWHRDESGLTMRYKPFKCIASIEIAPDTKLLRFELPNNATYSVPPCSTLQFRFHLSTSDKIERWYTPTTTDGTKGHFDIIVRHMPTGRMSGALCNMKPGEFTDVRMQQFKMRYRPNRFDEVGCIAGGTGITPMLQVIRQALPLADSDTYSKHICGGDFSKLGNTGDEIDPAGVAELKAQQAKDQTKISLLFLNVNEDNIMIKSYYDELAQRFPDRFRVSYCVDKPKHPGWKGFTGHVNTAMLAATMPAAKKKSEIAPKEGKKKNIILVSGPDGLVAACQGFSNQTMSVMHGGARSMGGSKKTTGMADTANLQPVCGPLADIGYDLDTVYRF